MNREEKAQEVGELSGKFAKATSAIVTDYRSLTVPVFQELRQNLRKNQAELRVAKNSLLSRAVTGTGFEALKGSFTGTTAVAFTYGDPVAAAKTVIEFSKDHPAFTIRGGALGGKLVNSEGITALSKLPGREVLLGQMLSVLNAVPTGLVRVLSGVPRKLLYALQAIHDQKQQAVQ